jgi:hypothetical protein
VLGSVLLAGVAMALTGAVPARPERPLHWPGGRP